MFFPGRPRIKSLDACHVEPSFDLEGCTVVLLGSVMVVGVRFVP